MADRVQHLQRRAERAAEVAERGQVRRRRFVAEEEVWLHRPRFVARRIRRTAPSPSTDHDHGAILAD